MNNKIRPLRESLKMTQFKLGTVADMAPSQIQQIEAGKRCSRPTAEKISLALGAPPEEVFPEFKTLRRW